MATIRVENPIDSDSEDSNSVESEDSTEGGHVITNSSKRVPDQGQHTSTTYIEIIHHPSSGIEPQFIFQNLPSLPDTTDHSHHQPTIQSTGKPWAPFHTRADFEFAETVIQSALSAPTIKKFLKGIKHDWTDPGHSRITFKGFKDFKQSMGAARNYVVQVSWFSFFLILYNYVMN